jgi:hypothetical protein
MSKRNDYMLQCPEHTCFFEPPAVCVGWKRAVRRQAELDLRNIWRLAAVFYPNIKVPKLPTEVR